MKISVYAICKNEEKHIKRWYESMREADEIYVLDTGSTDKSVEILKSLNINVKEKHYDHFTFDQARNDSLDLVSKDTDLCVCTDLDEVFNKGWRKNLEEAIDKNVDRVRYNLNFSFDENGNPLSSYYISKIHKRDKYRWTHIVHEVIEYIGDTPENVVTTDKIEINHYPDRLKNRSNYLKLLEEASKLNPQDDRDMHYLGREYMYKKDWDKSIETLKKHLELKSSIWKDERGASMRYISRCYIAKKDYAESEKWLKKALKETPNVREPYVEIGFLYYLTEDYPCSIVYLEKALTIKNKTETYINEEFSWNETINDLLSLCYFKINNIEKAIYNVKEALKLCPNNERLLKNYKEMSKLLDN